MRRMLLFLVAACATAAVAVPAAFAASPHFLFANSSIDPDTGALNVDFKEAGLGTGVTSVAITVTADATATYQCYNKSGNKPQGVPKTVGPSGVSGSDEFPVRNGQTTGTAVAGPLSQGTFSCPPGQILFLDAVSYSNIQVCDEGGNCTAADPDSLSATVHIRIS